MSDAKSPNKDWSFRSDTLDDAYRVARESFGGIAFFLSGVMGLVLALIVFANLKQAANAEEIGGIVGMAAEVVIIAVGAYRIRLGKGWLIGALLVILDAVEIVGKLVDGSLRSPGWVVFHCAVLFSLVMGTRACLQVRTRLRRGEVRRA